MSWIHTFRDIKFCWLVWRIAQSTATQADQKESESIPASLQLNITAQEHFLSLSLKGLTVVLIKGFLGWKLPGKWAIIWIQNTWTLSIPIYYAFPYVKRAENLQTQSLDKDYITRVLLNKYQLIFCFWDECFAYGMVLWASCGENYRQSNRSVLSNLFHLYMCICLG